MDFYDGLVQVLCQAVVVAACGKSRPYVALNVSAGVSKDHTVKWQQSRAPKALLQASCELTTAFMCGPYCCYNPSLVARGQTESGECLTETPDS